MPYYSTVRTIIPCVYMYADYGLGFVFVQPCASVVENETR